jgi:hypothetical protein
VRDEKSSFSGTVVRVDCVLLVEDLFVHPKVVHVDGTVERQKNHLRNLHDERNI